jgi:hypothetical protein
VLGKQGAWIKWLHLGEHYYNTTHHISIGMRPFMELYGYDVPSFVDLAFWESRAPKSKILVSRKPRHLESPEGEFGGCSESIEDVCR